jgi:hypothetical protein
MNSKSLVDHQTDWKIETAKKADLASSASFEVEFKMVADGKRLTFRMDDKGTGAVREDAAGNSNLVIPRGLDRQFNFRLSDDWDWEFDQDVTDGGGNKSPLRFKDAAHAKHYKVEWVTKRQIILYARSTNSANPQHHQFNLYVVMSQTKGQPIPVRIDPGADNPE